LHEHVAAYSEFRPHLWPVLPDYPQRVLRGPDGKVIIFLEPNATNNAARTAMNNKHQKMRISRVSRRLLQLVTLVALVSAASTTTSAQPLQLWTINADGTGLKHLADTPGYICGSPDWSPDGKLIAYDTWPVGKQLDQSQVAVIQAGGTNNRLIGPGAMPSWSPDGKQLVCHTYDNPQTIVVMNADGSGREVVINHWGSPRWSPRGNRIASVLNNNIGLYDLATGKERPILPQLYSSNLGFGIAPDGLRICFGGGSDGLYLATLNEKTMRATVRTLANQGVSHHASFAPDSKRIVVSWQPPGAKLSQLYVFAVESDDAPKLLAGQDQACNNFNPDWSPDGKTIVFVSQPPQVPVERVNEVNQPSAK
jgi:TolB protein